MTRVTVSDRNLQKMYTKHRADFGLSGPWNPGRSQAMRQAIIMHLESTGVQWINGTYRGIQVTHVVNPTTGLNVILDPLADAVIGGWSLSDEQLRSVLGVGRLF